MYERWIGALLVVGASACTTDSGSSGPADGGGGVGLGVDGSSGPGPADGGGSVGPGDDGSTEGDSSATLADGATQQINTIVATVDGVPLTFVASQYKPAMVVGTLIGIEGMTADGLHSITINFFKSIATQSCASSGVASDQIGYAVSSSDGGKDTWVSRANPCQIIVGKVGEIGQTVGGTFSGTLYGSPTTVMVTEGSFLVKVTE